MPLSNASGLPVITVKIPGTASINKKIIGGKVQTASTRPQTCGSALALAWLRSQVLVSRDWDAVRSAACWYLPPRDLTCFSTATLSYFRQTECARGTMQHLHGFRPASQPLVVSSALWNLTWLSLQRLVQYSLLCLSLQLLLVRKKTPFRPHSTTFQEPHAASSTCVHPHKCASKSIIALTCSSFRIGVQCRVQPTRPAVGAGQGVCCWMEQPDRGKNLVHAEASSWSYDAPEWQAHSHSVI